MTCARTSARGLLAALAAVLVSVAGTAAAMAHAGYDHSNPADGAVVPAAPDRVHVWFTQEIRKVEGMNSLRVLDGAGTRVDLGDLAVDDDDRTHLSVGLRQGLGEGVYTVHWRTTSDGDGDTDAGAFTFTVSVSATTTPAALTPAPPSVTPAPPSVAAAPETPSPPPEPGGDGASTANMIAAAAIGTAMIALGVVGIGFYRRMQRR